MTRDVLWMALQCVSLALAATAWVAIVYGQVRARGVALGLAAALLPPLGAVLAFRARQPVRALVLVVSLCVYVSTRIVT
jgi:hypothetical protein